MQRTKSTLTVSSAAGMAKGTVLSVGAGATAELVKVRGVTGAGPYQVEIRRVTRWDRARWWLGARWRRLVRPVTRPVRQFRLSRCEADWCWRPETGRGWCWKHDDGLEDD
jgi:hypothetical protein